GDLLFSAPPSQQEAGTAEPLKLALSAEPGKAFTASFGNREISAELTRLLSDAKVPKAIHNYKAALRELQCRGVELAGMRDEPMLYSYLVNPTYPRHSLAEIALRSFNLMLSDSLPEAADVTARITTRLRQEVEAGGLMPVYEKIDLPLLPVL